MDLTCAASGIPQFCQARACDSECRLGFAAEFDYDLEAPGDSEDQQ